MAVLHQATLSPTKPDLLAAWVPDQPWAAGTAGDVEIVGAFRFDDPEGEVGVETFLVRRGDTILHVPFTYRGERLTGADAHLVTTMQHSVLGDRWVYDAVGDPVYVRLLAAATLTGSGQAVALVERDSRWTVVPSPIRLSGGGWTGGPVAVDGFEPVATDDATSQRLRSDRFELTVVRRPVAGSPTVGLLAELPDGGTVVLAEIAPVD